MSTTIINLNLDPAALLYRAKILNRRRSAIPADVVPLPSFQWQVDKRRVTGFDENEVVRTWTRYIASILVSIARKKPLTSASWPCCGYRLKGILSPYRSCALIQKFLRPRTPPHSSV